MLTGGHRWGTLGNTKITATGIFDGGLGVLGWTSTLGASKYQLETYVTMERSKWSMMFYILTKSSQLLGNKARMHLSTFSGGLFETPVVGLRGRGGGSSPRLDAARKTGAFGPREGSGDRF